MAPEQRVGVACERGIDLVVALLAVLKAGAAYVPLDPAYPADRVAYMAEDSGLRWVLAQGHLLPALQMPAGVAVLPIETMEAMGQAPCLSTDPGVPVSPDGLAYVIYTSGSTGRPKGAQLSHRNVTRLLDRTAPWFGFGPQDTWTLFHSYAFDFSVWEIFGALCTGGRLVVVPHHVSRSPEDFERLLRSQRVTVLNQTPSAFGQLAHLPQALAPGLSLRWVIFGGEALDPQRLRGWIARTATRPRSSSTCMASRKPRYTSASGASPRPTWRARAVPSAKPFPTWSCTCSMRSCTRCRWAWPASCMWRARAWRVAT